MSKLPRTRFAPSPTGDLHIGGARTALFNFLFAKSLGGTFILRIEDTDQERSSTEAVETIISGLEWLGMHADEGPFFQSERNELYKKAAEKLLLAGRAYPCYCSPEEIEEMREAARAKGEKPAYNGKHRNETCQSVPTGKEDKPYVLRLKTPKQGSIKFKDLVVDEISTENSEIDDFIIFRSNGTPTYNFTVVVDDLEMNISHVIRGMDHISNTPKQICIYQALEAEIPLFAHVPMILGTDKKKLSKRHGATSVFEYRGEGYLSEAFINYLARLGWSHGDQEIFNPSELTKLFSIDKVSKSDAVFDFEKLRWVNGEHLKKAEVNTFLPFLTDLCSGKQGTPLNKIQTEQLSKLALSLKDRSKTLVEIADAAMFLFSLPKLEQNPAQIKKIFNQNSKLVYSEFLSELKKIENPDPKNIEKLLTSCLEKHSIGFAKLGKPIRLALTGNPAGLAIPDIIINLGVLEAAARLESALKHFQ